MGIRDPEDVGVAVPNALTLLRLPLAALFWVAPGWPPYAFSVLALAALTDVLDGWFVRRWRRRRWSAHDPGAFAAGTGRGPWLDALCDKIFVVSVVVAVGVTVEPPVYSLLLVATREILVTPLAIGYRFMPEAWRREYDFSAGPLGKLTTVLQFVAIGLALLRSPWLVEIAWVVAASGAASVAYYVRRAMLTSSRTFDRPRHRDPE